MAVGTKTGGRVAGVPNRATAARQAEIAASGLTPLEFMLSVLRDHTREFPERFEAAKAAAPYVHPKLASSTVDLGAGTINALADLISARRAKVAAMEAGDGN